MFRISQEGIDLIKSFEGLVLDAYLDAVDIWTIGYGHTGAINGFPTVAAAVEANGGPFRITEAEAEDLLRQDLDEFERGVNAAIRGPATQSMFDAFTSLAFNIGVSACTRSTAMSRHNGKDYPGAAEAITWWNKAGGQVLSGLVRRRAAESALYLRDLDELDESAAVGAAQVEENSPRRSNPVTTRTTAGAATAGGAGAAGTAAVLLDDEDEDPAAGSGTPAGSDQDDGGTPATDSASTGDGSTDADPEANGETSEENGTDIEETGAADTESGDPTDGDSITTGSTTEQPEQEMDIPIRDATDAIIVAAGILAVLAAIYVIGARIDDWRKFRR